jgi:hypothetical protein
MSDPNSVLSVWQLTLIAVVPLALLIGWLIAIFLAAREPRGQVQAAAASPASGLDASGLDAAGQDEPTRPDRRLAA